MFESMEAILFSFRLSFGPKLGLQGLSSQASFLWELGRLEAWRSRGVGRGEGSEFREQLFSIGTFLAKLAVVSGKLKPVFENLFAGSVTGLLEFKLEQEYRFIGPEEFAISCFIGNASANTALVNWFAEMG